MWPDGAEGKASADRLAGCAQSSHTAQRGTEHLARVHDLAGCSCEISLPSRPSMTEHGGVVGLPPNPWSIDDRHVLADDE